VRQAALVSDKSALEACACSRRCAIQIDDPYLFYLYCVWQVQMTRLAVRSTFTSLWTSRQWRRSLTHSLIGPTRSES